MIKIDNMLLVKWGATYGHRALTTVLLPLQLSLLAFSLLYPNSFLFFLCLKTYLVIGILLLLIEHKKPTKQDCYDCLVILPGIWATSIGIVSANPGVYFEVPVYLLAPATYLVVLRFSSLSFFKLLIPILKFACAVNLAAFFFMYFSKGGELYSVLQHYTQFVIQQHDGFNKVFTLQATQLVFLLPVILIHFYYKKNAINFILVVGCVLMALLIARKAILIMLVVFVVFILLYSIYKRCNVKSVIGFVSPVVLAMAVFSQISSFDNEKFSDAMLNSFPSTQLSEYAIASGDTLQSSMSQSSMSQSSMSQSSMSQKISQNVKLWEELYMSEDNICSKYSIFKLAASSDKRGALIRQNQIKILSHQFKISPWFGHGLGYIVAQCIRSAQQPWRYELTYLGMAMNIGILGVLLYCFVYTRWVIGIINSNLDKSICFPLVGGSMFFLICAATNPYIMCVEHLWIFFIPYLLVHINDHKQAKKITETLE